MQASTRAAHIVRVSRERGRTVPGAPRGPLSGCCCCLAAWLRDLWSGEVISSVMHGLDGGAERGLILDSSVNLCVMCRVLREIRLQVA